MFTVKQFDALPKARRSIVCVSHLFIPSNSLRIRAGYYGHLDIIALLRRHAGNRARIVFIADMLE